MKEKINTFLKKSSPFIFIILGMLLGYGVDISIRPTENKIEIVPKFQIELSPESIPALITTDEGQTQIEVPTVESIDSDQLTYEEGADKGSYADISSPEAFAEFTVNKCWDEDGHYGSQCVDLAKLFWSNYTDRNFSTCGTGAAKGALDCYEYNAGEEFEMVWNPEDLQAGDWIIFTNGMYGHVGMALGSYNNGYIALLGTNQGGSSCEHGGSAANIINISLKNFGGAFRPKMYKKPEPVIPISGCLEWAVKRGDTMTKIMYECEGFIEYGEVMNEYAKSWYSRIIKPGQSVYDGWNSETGVGLYANDIIDHRF